MPSGPFAIGRVLLDLTDAGRTDPFAKEPGAPRELMVSVWYPAVAAKGEQASYFPGAAEVNHSAKARAAATDVFGKAWPMIVNGSLRSHAVADAPPLTSKGLFPVVLFSHGSAASGFSYTAQIEDLVSHGYVVAAIEHTDAAALVRFPGGRVRLRREPATPVAGEKDSLQAMIASAMEETQTGADDVSFVLDALLEGGNAATPIMDLKRVAAVGHSYGGTLSVRACQTEARLSVCMSEEGAVTPVGAFFDHPDRARVPRPLLLLEEPQHPTDADLAQMGMTRAMWNDFDGHEREQLARCPAGSVRVLVERPGMGHASFSDGPSLNAAAGSAEAATAQANLLVLDEVVRGFLDQILKGKKSPIFRGETSIDGVRIERVGHERG